MDLKNDETSAMEGVSIVWGAEIPVTSGGLGAYYYSLMTAFGRCAAMHQTLRLAPSRRMRDLTKP
ncbi:hypothetical protein [Rhizobium chutanense]|uniref:hypothetical protein n=1 Tax=Rhizobium chutanense TaxID=2035448 RepID=UPI000F895024|nr:hypothetical protein [Rhizobium chutanense]